MQDKYIKELLAVCQFALDTLEFHYNPDAHKSGEYMDCMEELRQIINRHAVKE